jgi:hypothetical protein
MTEEYGHIPDAFHLSQKEVEELRNSKKELTEYAKKKLQELMNKEAERKALEALEIARKGMVEYKDALEELKDK